MKTAIDQCRFHTSIADEVIARLDDSHRALEPHPGMKTAGWLIGHLAVTGDFARHLCGGRPICQRDWRAAFNPGSTPSPVPADYPSMLDLAQTFRAVYGDLPTTVVHADPALLSRPNPYEAGRADFPTAGDFVAFLISGHLAYHLGQLVAWCAAASLGRVRGPAA